MAKLILIVLAGWLVFTILKNYRQSVDRREPPRTGKTAGGEPMVQCHQCGLHLPQSESVAAHGRHFCCQAHADMARDARRD